MVPLKPEFQRTQIGWRRGVTIDFFSPLGSLFREARGFDTKRGLINAKKITLKFVLFDLKHLFPPGDYVSLSGSQRQKIIVKHQLNSTQKQLCWVRHSNHPKLFSHFWTSYRVEIWHTHSLD